jgi:hypothetical protein
MLEKFVNKIYRYLILLPIVLLSSSAPVIAADTLRVMDVFDHILNKTGFWNTSLVIRPKGKTVMLDKSNTIILSGNVANLCFEGYSVSEGNDRLAFLLCHEISHIINNDLDYDRFFNPLNDKLANEPLELRRKKEISADLRAVSLMVMSGFSLKQFDKPEENIISDIYRFYGMSDKGEKNAAYLSASERVQAICERKRIITEYGNLYEFANLLLQVNDGSREMLDICLEAYESYKNLSSITTPELFNNLGLAYLKKAESLFSKNYLEKPDTIDFLKFETGYAVNSEVPVVRSVNIMNNTPAVRRSDDLRVYDYKNAYKKAASCFNQACLISNNQYLPARINPVILLGLNQQYKEAWQTLCDINDNESEAIKRYGLLPFFHNLCGIVEYCSGNREKSASYLDEAQMEEPEFKASIKNKEMISGKRLDMDPMRGENSESALLNSVIAAYDMLKQPAEKCYSFGLRDNYSLSFRENDSVKTISVAPRDLSYGAEFICIKRGGLAGTGICIGAGRKTIMKKLSGRYSLYFSRKKVSCYIKKAGLILCFDDKDILDKIVIVNKKEIADK